ncbi:TetR/AcrR family transcriptional regulator [Pokkaliibacter sp. CJK22405]|uniref:TetR/AcrR family transcriptional regulator n=1 Tax=Pokkaliibacter sp. CJK22405 TaxID=3384615 RepID=UPI003984B61C
MAESAVPTQLERRQERRQEILSAAHELLLAPGNQAISMLAIAKAVGASKETLYAWFGNRDGLFSELIETYADAVLQPILTTQPAKPREQEEACLMLLRFWLSPQTSALVRAIIGDTSPVLHERLLQVLVAPSDEAFARFSLDTAQQDLASHLTGRFTGPWQLSALLGSQAEPDPEALAMHVRDVMSQLQNAEVAQLQSTRLPKSPKKTTKTEKSGKTAKPVKDSKNIKKSKKKKPAKKKYPDGNMLSD